MEAVSVRKALRRAAEELPGPNGRRDAELLLLRLLGRDRAWLLTHPDAVLAPEDLARYEGWVARRQRQEPVQYIVSEQEFWGLRLKVTPAVLIPRPETEHLVQAMLDRVSGDRAVRILDVGTGSGAIAVALAHSLPLAEVVAVDVSAAALEVARSNAEALGLGARIRWVESDLLAGVAGERFEVIVSNPPYVPQDEVLEPQVRGFEPHTALFAGPDGLEIYRRLIPEAEQALVPGGWLMMEIGHGQREAVRELLAGFEEIGFVPDLQGIPRIAVARKPEGTRREFDGE